MSSYKEIKARHERDEKMVSLMIHSTYEKHQDRAELLKLLDEALEVIRFYGNKDNKKELGYIPSYVEADDFLSKLV